MRDASRDRRHGPRRPRPGRLPRRHVTYGKPGEAAAKVLSKGWLVAFDGRLEYHEWDGEHGKRNAIAGVGNVEFLSAPRNGRSEADADSTSSEPQSDDDIAF